jgi:hypothetical protein
MLARVAQTLAGQIVAAGIASEEELGAATLEQRMVEEVRAAGAVVLLPAVVGAWGRRAA